MHSHPQLYICMHTSSSAVDGHLVPSIKSYTCQLNVWIEYFYNQNAQPFSSLTGHLIHFIPSCTNTYKFICCWWLVIPFIKWYACEPNTWIEYSYNQNAQPSPAVPACIRVHLLLTTTLSHLLNDTLVNQTHE